MLLPLLFLSSSAWAASIVEGSIGFSDFLVSAYELPLDTHVTLENSHSKFTAPLLISGAFSFPAVPESSYVLSVSCTTHEFGTYRVDVLPAESGRPGASEELAPAPGPDEPRHDMYGIPLPPTPQHRVKVYKTTRGTSFKKRGPAQAYPVALIPTARTSYYTPRTTFNLFTMLKNPMVLVGLVMFMSVFGLPVLTQYLDPEGIQEMDRIKAERETAVAAARANSKSGGAQPAIENPVEKLTNFDVSGWLAGKKKK